MRWQKLQQITFVKDLGLFCQTSLGTIECLASSSCGGGVGFRLVWLTAGSSYIYVELHRNHGVFAEYETKIKLSQI